MVADEQTQRLPWGGDDLKRFAKFCGYANLKAFEKALRREAGIVQRHYALLFEEGPELASDVGSLVFTGTADDPETLSTSAPPRLSEPGGRRRDGARLAFRPPAGDPERPRPGGADRARPRLACGSAARPIRTALAALDRAFGRMPAAVELLTILQSHDRLRLLFADLLGTAPRLADTVARRRARARRADRSRSASRSRRTVPSRGRCDSSSDSRTTSRISSTAPATPRARCASSPERGFCRASYRRSRPARPIPPSRGR